MNLATFDGYQLREVTEADRAELAAWIALEPSHAGVKPEFFMGLDEQLAPDPRATCYAMEQKGKTLFYIRLSRAARVNIQFGPGGRRWANAIPLVKGMAFLEVGLARAGAEEWIYNTQSNRLREMTEKHMQFERSPFEMVRMIPRLGAGKGGN
jgi:hypothetical protein